MTASFRFRVGLVKHCCLRISPHPSRFARQVVGYDSPIRDYLRPE
jgi:hypothetical protein